MSCLNLNKWIGVGRLTADPELKKTPNGVSVTSFSVAINRPKSKDGGEQQADFINVIAWRERAEFVAKYFRRGAAIFISGSIQTRNWQDQSGQKRYATEILANEVMFVDSKNDSQVAPSFGTTATPQFEELSADDDLPF